MSLSNCLTYNIREDQLVEYFHDRNHGACFVADIRGCLELLGFGSHPDFPNCLVCDIGDKMITISDPEGMDVVNGEPILVAVHREEPDGSWHMVKDDILSPDDEYGETHPAGVGSYTVALERIIDAMGVAA